MKVALLVVLIVIVFMPGVLSAADPIVPDGRVKADDYTVLMAVDARAKVAKARADLADCSNPAAMGSTPPVPTPGSKPVHA